MITITQIHKMIESYLNGDMNGSLTELDGYTIKRLYIKIRDLIPENPIYDTHKKLFRLYHIENMMIFTKIIDGKEKIIFYLKKD